MRMPFLVAAVDRALRARRARPRAARRSCVALSGGADSVALTDVLASLQRRRGFRLVAAHLDHGLRPARPTTRPSVTRFCAALGVPLPRRERAACASARARERRARAGRAPRALLVPAPGEGRRGRRGDRRRAHPGRPGRDAAAAPAARRRRERARRHAAAQRRPAAPAARGLARARCSSTCAPAVSPGARTPRTPTRPTCATACATSCCRTSSSASTRACARRSRGPRRCSPTRPPTSRRSRGARRADRDPRRRRSRPRPRRARPAPVAVARDAVRLALHETGGLAGVDGGHVDRLLRLADSAAPAGRRLLVPGGREARFTHRQLRLEKRANRGPRKPYHRPGPTDEGQDLRAVQEEQIAERVAELGEEITKGLRRAGDLRPRPDEGQPRLHVRPDPQAPPRPDGPPGPRHLQPRAGPGSVQTEIVFSTAVPLEGRDVLLSTTSSTPGSRSATCSRTSTSTGRAASRCARSSTSPRRARSTFTPTGPRFPCTSRSPTASWSATGSTGWSASGACPTSARSPGPRAPGRPGSKLGLEIPSARIRGGGAVGAAVRRLSQ